MSRNTVKLLFSAAAAMVLGLSANWAVADDAELAHVRQTVSEMFDTIIPENVNASPVPGWYTIQKGPIVAYISGDGRYLLQGDLIDLDEQVNLTEVARNDSRRELIASVADDETIVFSPENPEYTVTVFTDVDCTYCRRLHSQIDEYMANGIRVRYLLYPRNGPSSHAWTISENVWCSPDRGNALTMAKLDRDFPSSTCDTPIVSEHYAIGKEVGLSGTPAIVLEDGTLIGGYMPPDQLKARLDQLAKHP
jgi:thiol:disulfide interchange protein DsbC